jgi:hypothetical protein
MDPSAMQRGDSRSESATEQPNELKHQPGHLECPGLKSNNEGFNMTNSTTSASASTAPLEVICEEFRSFAKNTVVGFATLSFPAIGLRIHDVAVHVTADRKMWIGWPSREKNGNWVRLIEEVDGPAHFRLQAVAVKSIKKYLDSLQVPAPSQPSTKPETPHTDIPR